MSDSFATGGAGRAGDAGNTGDEPVAGQGATLPR